MGATLIDMHATLCISYSLVVYCLDTHVRVSVVLVNYMYNYN